jgi:hypothetical protein
LDISGVDHLPDDSFLDMGSISEEDHALLSPERGADWRGRFGSADDTRARGEEQDGIPPTEVLEDGDACFDATADTAEAPVVAAPVLGFARGGVPLGERSRRDFSEGSTSASLQPLPRTAGATRSALGPGDRRHPFSVPALPEEQPAMAEENVAAAAEASPDSSTPRRSRSSARSSQEAQNADSNDEDADWDAEDSYSPSHMPRRATTPLLLTSPTPREGRRSIAGSHGHHLHREVAAATSPTMSPNNSFAMRRSSSFSNELVSARHLDQLDRFNLRQGTPPLRDSMGGRLSAIYFTKSCIEGGTGNYNTVHNLTTRRSALGLADQLPARRPYTPLTGIRRSSLGSPHQWPSSRQASGNTLMVGDSGWSLLARRVRQGLALKHTGSERCSLFSLSCFISFFLHLASSLPLIMQDDSTGASAQPLASTPTRPAWGSERPRPASAASIPTRSALGRDDILVQSRPPPSSSGLRSGPRSNEPSAGAAMEHISARSAPWTLRPLDTAEAGATEAAEPEPQPTILAADTLMAASAADTAAAEASGSTPPHSALFAASGSDQVFTTRPRRRSFAAEGEEVGAEPGQLRRSVSFAPSMYEHSHAHAHPTRSRPAPLAPVLDPSAMDGMAYRTPPPSPGGHASPSAVAQRSALVNIGQGLSTPSVGGSRTTNTIIALASHRSHEDMM